MWLVKLALRNPYTVGILAFLIFMMGTLSILAMRVDMLPDINIPVVNVIWNFTGLPAQEMENRVIFQAERGYTNTVDGISRMESHSISGDGTIKIYLQEGTDIGAAVAQIVSSSLTSMRAMPPSIQPPTILPFNASNVPVAQLTMESDTVPEEQLFDYAQNFVRLKLFTLPGLSTPAPYGGKNRQINIDVRPDLLTAKGLSPQDVVNTLNDSNLVIPAGTARIGPLEYAVLMNSSPQRVEDFDKMPVKSFNQRTVTLGEVARVSDAFADQTSVVRVNGKRATYLNILKKATASTLDVVNEVKNELKEIRNTSLKGIKYSIDFDQSVFVKATMWSVIREALIAAFLVSIMILFFLGSGKSVFIVCTSIPLSIFVSIICLKLTGQTLNMMTLGGLSLAIGMLVDDATVEVENIDRNRQTEPSLTLAILRAASQVALPAIMSTLAICVVFSPVLLLTGPARYLFVPMALSVVFAMLASYVLSRTVVPTLSRMMLDDPEREKREKAEGHPVISLQERSARRKAKQGFRARFAKRWEKFDTCRIAKFEALENRYVKVLSVVLQERLPVIAFLVLLLGISLTLPFFVIGQDFFPTTDAGLMKMHYRARAGLRIEQSEKEIAKVEDRIRAVIPPSELKNIESFTGVPIFYNLAFVSTDNIGAMDSEIQISLNEDHKTSTEAYQKKLRKDLQEHFPGSTLYFQAADIMNQVLNFGQSSALDIQVEAKQFTEGLAIAQKLEQKVRDIPGAVDLHVMQLFDYPTLHLDVDRVKASRIGLTQKDVAANMLISLSSSSLYAPSFFLNNDNHVTYNVVAKVPLARINSVDDLLRTPITSMSGPSFDPGNDTFSGQNAIAPGQNIMRQAPAPLLGNLGMLDTQTIPGEASHVDVQRVVDIIGGVEDRDLGGVAKDIRKAIADMGELPAGVHISLKGQAEVMGQTFPRLALGLVIAIVLVFSLMVMLFQSWVDPFIVMSALPGALVGILWMLALTGTTINVESLMGSIMAVGIATSNAILMVSFANDLRLEHHLDPMQAALQAGQTRLRPVMMTALAMILGMLPMSLGLGEGGSQNAPLARAVIGGLFVATLSTLFIVPMMYSILRKSLPQKLAIRQQLQDSEQRFDQEMADIQQGASSQAGGSR